MQASEIALRLRRIDISTHNVISGRQSTLFSFPDDGASVGGATHKKEEDSVCAKFICLRSSLSSSPRLLLTFRATS